MEMEMEMEMEMIGLNLDLIELGRIGVPDDVFAIFAQQYSLIRGLLMKPGKDVLESLTVRLQHHEQTDEMPRNLPTEHVWCSPNLELEKT